MTSGFIHGHTSPSKGGPTRTYRSWSNMIARCTYPNSKGYEHYKKRGITVCDRWRKFENFLSDMGECPDGLTLDRTENDGNYEPGNCQWVTWQKQGNNRITNLQFIYKGHAYTLSDLVRKTGQSKDILRQRLCRSHLPWTVEGAVETPALNRSRQGFYC